MKEFREYIRKNKIMIKDIAKEVGYHSQHVSNVFTGRSRATERFMIALIGYLHKHSLRKNQELQYLIKNSEWKHLL